MAYCKKQVADDCEYLLGRFQKTESVRFEVFAKIWKEAKFSEIFYGIGATDGFESKAFSRQILTTAYRYFVPPYSFQIRVGGLYLLYGLYSNQLAQPKVQIQLPLSDWEVLKKFEKDAVEALHFDAVYILRKLFSQKAFHFAAMPRHLCYGMKKTMPKQSVCEKFMERTSRPQELVYSDLLEELSNVHEHYERSKAAMSEQTEVAFSLIHSDLVPQLRGAVRDFSTWQGKMVSPVPAEDDDGEGTSTQRESYRRAQLLASIKSKSYGHAVEASKARRHRQVEIDYTGHVTGLANQMTESAKYKPSLKSRTDKNILIKGVLKKETTKCTKVWHLTAPERATDDVPRKTKKFKW